MIVVGIDPGITGAIGVLRFFNGSALFEHAEDMPVESRPLQPNRNQVDAAMLARILRSWEPDLVVYEQPPVMSAGSLAVASLHDSCGQVKGVIGALCLRSIAVRPQDWKKRANLSGVPRAQSKEAARRIAMELWPEAPLHRKKDSDRAEALLIAKLGAPTIVHQQNRRHASC